MCDIYFKYLTHIFFKNLAFAILGVQKETSILSLPWYIFLYNQVNDQVKEDQKIRTWEVLSP